MKKQGMPKIIVVVGPTASGKSDYAIRLARKIGGEIISADSRQVYCGLDIGSGKVTPHEQKIVPHHLLDVASPRRNFSAGQFVKLARRAITDILRRGKIPIIVGGSGFYIDAVVYGIPLPSVKPNYKLRTLLEKKSANQLTAILKKINPERLKTMDTYNSRRMIRAIEVARWGHAQSFRIADFYVYTTMPVAGQEVILEWIGLNPGEKQLRKNILRRLNTRLRNGMVEEVRRLRRRGLSWQRLEHFGLEYKWLALFLQKKITRAQMRNGIITDSVRYAKRQLTWFRRNPNISWLS